MSKAWDWLFLNCRKASVLVERETSNAVKMQVVSQLFWAALCVLQAQRRRARAVCLYQPGPPVLLGQDGSPGPQPGFPSPFDTEHSANSEGSHETGDSGRFSHESNDEIHLSLEPGATPPGSSPLASSDCPAVSRASGCAEPPLRLPAAHSPLQAHPKWPRSCSAPVCSKDNEQGA